MAETFGLHPAPMTAQMFVNAGMEHMEKYGGVKKRWMIIGISFQAPNVNTSPRLPTRTTSTRSTIRKNNEIGLVDPETILGNPNSRKNTPSTK